MTGAPPFGDVVRDVAELRTHFRAPSETVQRKQIDHLDEQCRAFIARSPFVLVATANEDGTCDVSPKGGPPGFVPVLDGHRLAIGDLPGNNRIDSLRNIVANPNVGLLFVVPGMGETLRVNGQAWVVRDAAVLDACAVHDKRPAVAIGVEVHEAYVHCAKAFRRSNLWEPEAWPERATVPTAGEMLRAHVGLHETSAETIDQALEDGYAKTMW